jgi:hypothetical protein
MVYLLNVVIVGIVLVLVLIVAVIEQVSEGL